uniref:Deoxynucleoside kinase domain-containing protein n=1 Tax=Arcella intermedia TaxID=1963864 RepID=A0A6B2LJ06_9EUKA
MEKVFIGIAGLIGAGKSTLAQSLATKLNLPAYFEEVTENDYLQDFYKDMKKHSFALQVYLLNRRFKQHQQIIWQGKGGVQDRTIYEDAVFAKMLKEDGLMEERDYQTYLDLSNNMSNFMRKPNLIVYLDVSPEVSLKRIQERGREMEKTITLKYLQSLHNAYEAFILSISKVIPVIRVDWNQFHTPEEMAEKIKEEYHKLQTIHTVNW